MTKNVATQLLELLSDVGVKQIFGVTGDALNFFVKAIEEQDQVEWVGMKHEGNGSFAAFAQGELGDALGVCAGTTGPGALHLINGLYNAKKERSPVIVITGQVPLKKMGINYFQEVDLQKMFDDVCEYQAVIRSPEQAPKIVQRAIKIALAKRAVCRIELPSDIAEMDAKSEEYIGVISPSDAVLVPGEKSIKRAAEAINKAKKITILAGHGCRQTRAEVLSLSRKLNAPIVHTLKASDIFDHDTENVVGLTGLIGNPSGYSAIMNCDLLLMLATDFPYSEFLPHATKTVQVDIRAENIGNRTSVEVGVNGDVRPFIQKLLPQVNPKEEDSFLSKLKGNFNQWRKNMKDDASPERDNEPLHPQIFADLLNTHAADDAIFTIETGTSAIWAAHHISFHTKRRLIGSFNHGSMGVGLPAAIGAQFLDRSREVWALTGDGAFNMVMHDFITAVKYELPLKVLVFNNSELSFVKLEMEEAGLSPSLEALDQQNVNFAEYARLCGGEGIRVVHAEEIENAIIMAKKSTKPFVIDAVVSSGEISLPPHIGVGQAVGFGTSKAKEGIQAVMGDKKQWENLKKELQSYFD